MSSLYEPVNWIGHFRGSNNELLFLSSKDDFNLASLTSKGLIFRYVGDTRGFTKLIPRVEQWGDLIWMVDMNGDGRSDFLLYHHRANEFWLGSLNLSSLRFEWNLVSDAEENEGKINPFPYLVWLTDMNGDGKPEILTTINDGWWLGTFNNTRLRIEWKNASRSEGNFFGNWHFAPWATDIDGDGKSEILFDNDKEGQTWLGHLNQNTGHLDWRVISQSTGMESVFSAPIAYAFKSITDMDGDGKSEVLIYNQKLNRFFLGFFSAATGRIDWRPVSDTTTLGKLMEGFHRFWIVDLDGDGRSEILLHHIVTGNWWLAKFDKVKQMLVWSVISNTTGFGNLFDGSHDLWIADFDGDMQSEILFHYFGDGRWWLGKLTGLNIRWTTVAARLKKVQRTIVPESFSDSHNKSGTFVITLWRNNSASYVYSAATPDPSNNATIVKMHSPRHGSFALAHLDRNGNRTPFVTFQSNTLAEIAINPFNGMKVEGTWIAHRVGKTTRAPDTLGISIDWKNK